MMSTKLKKSLYILSIIVILLTVILILRNNFTKKPPVNIVDETTNQEQVSVDENVLKTNTNIVTSVDIDKKFNEIMTKARAAALAGESTKALELYNEALKVRRNDTAYAGIYTIYLNQKNWSEALKAINSAIEINPLLGDYWKWKILVMSEGLKSSFTELRAVYEQGLPKIKTEEKVNLVTYFARISEVKGEKAYAITLWQKAIELYPENKTVYQAEIDRLSK